MPEELIDEFTRDGKVFSGADFIADVQFTLRTYQEYVTTMTHSGGGKIPTLKRHALVILTASHPLPMMGSKLTLHIGDDDDKLDFFRTSATANQVTGTIYR